MNKIIDKVQASEAGGPVVRPTGCRGPDTGIQPWEMMDYIT